MHPSYASINSVGAIGWHSSRRSRSLSRGQGADPKTSSPGDALLPARWRPRDRADRARRSSARQLLAASIIVDGIASSLRQRCQRPERHRRVGAALQALDESPDASSRGSHDPQCQHRRVAPAVEHLTRTLRVGASPRRLRTRGPYLTTCDDTRRTPSAARSPAWRNGSPTAARYDTRSRVSSPSRSECPGLHPNRLRARTSAAERRMSPGRGGPYCNSRLRSSATIF